MATRLDHTGLLQGYPLFEGLVTLVSKSVASVSYTRAGHLWWAGSKAENFSGRRSGHPYAC